MPASALPASRLNLRVVPGERAILKGASAPDRLSSKVVLREPLAAGSYSEYLAMANWDVRAHTVKSAGDPWRRLARNISKSADFNGGIAEAGETLLAARWTPLPPACRGRPRRRGSDARPDRLRHISTCCLSITASSASSTAIATGCRTRRGARRSRPRISCGATPRRACAPSSTCAARASAAPTTSSAAPASSSA